MEEVKEAIKQFVIKTLKREDAHPQEIAIVPELIKVLNEMQ